MMAFLHRVPRAFGGQEYLSDHARPQAPSRLPRHRRPERGGEDHVRPGIPAEGSGDRPFRERGFDRGRPVAAEPVVGGCGGGPDGFGGARPARQGGGKLRIRKHLERSAYAKRLRRWKEAGYRIQIIFLKLDSPELALKRVAARVKQGGHDVPKEDLLRRFERGWWNFLWEYRHLADSWAVYDNSGDRPILLEAGR